MVVHDNHVIHAIFFGPIKPTMMGQIIQMLMDFDEGPINKSNVALELWKLCCQNSLLFNNGPLNLVSNGIIYVKCNKYVIIIYCTLVSTSYENIVFSHIIKFYVQDEIK